VVSEAGATSGSVVSQELRSRIEREMSHYPQKRGALLAALHLVQAEYGHISLDATRELAALFEIRPIEVLEVVSFYNMFHSQPVGRHQVQVCTNLPCSLAGSRSLLAQLEIHLGIRAGETTADGRISLGHEECLGACAYAPMLRIGGDYHENLDVGRAVALLDALE
jgi:NADH-quinone oxidoreductase subunit E